MYYRKVVRQVGYLPELYEDARSEKYILKKVFLNVTSVGTIIFIQLCLQLAQPVLFIH